MTTTHQLGVAAVSGGYWRRVSTAESMGMAGAEAEARHLLRGLPRRPVEAVTGLVRLVRPHLRRS